MKRFLLTLSLCVIGTIAAASERRHSHSYLRMYENKSNLSALSERGNPFDESTHEYFVNPWFAKEVEASKTLTQTQKDKLKMIPAAFWIDTQSAISQRTPSVKTLLESAAEKQKTSSKKQTLLFIIYDLPNRDCAAAASNGEFCCSGNSPDPKTGSCDDASYNSGDCSQGLNNYHIYIDEIVSLLAQYPQLEIVTIVEPDSLPNLSTNMGVLPHCTATTQQGYVEGVAYAITKLATLSHVTMYIDSAHGGWLGWCGNHPCGSDSECNGDKCMRGYCECPASQTNQNAQKYVSAIKEIFDKVGSASSAVRGFATNTANYQPLGYPEDKDNCQLSSQWNFAYNELRYIDQMDSLFKKNGISKFWITDTGRNGVPEKRSSSQACQQWCNIEGGLGYRPTSEVSDINKSLVSAKLDALVWAKTPGESDGCSPGSGQSCTRVDSMCQRDCSSGFQKCPAPEAGKWDDDMIKILVNNARPSL